MKHARRLLLVAAASLAACNVDVEPQFRVKDVRILAVRARVLPGAPGQPFLADVSPGDTVTLDALVANPLGRTDLTIDWFACLPPASDAVTPCADLATLKDPTRFATLASGPNPTVLALGSGASVQVGVPALTDALGFVIGTAVSRPGFACRMYADVIVVVVASAAGKHGLAVKTVRVKPPAAVIAAAGVQDLYVLNANPIFGDVYRAPVDADTCSGGISLSSGRFPPGRTTLCATALALSAQTFNVCDPGTVTPTDESLNWQWYVTDGDFPDAGGVGNATGDHADFVRPGGPFTLWSIVRDGRGGDDWVTVVVSAP